MATQDSKKKKYGESLLKSWVIQMMIQDELRRKLHNHLIRSGIIHGRIRMTIKEEYENKVKEVILGLHEWAQEQPLYVVDTAKMFDFLSSKADEAGEKLWNDADGDMEIELDDKEVELRIEVDDLYSNDAEPWD